MKDKDPWPPVLFGRAVTHLNGYRKRRIQTVSRNTLLKGALHAAQLFVSAS